MRREIEKITASPCAASFGTRRVPATICNSLGEAWTVDVFHGEKILAVELADLVDVDDIRVSQSSGGLGFDLKTADQLGRSQMAGQNHLHGDGAIESFLPSFVDHAHAAAADLADQFVGSEIARQFADGRGGVGIAAVERGGFAGRRGQHFQRIEAVQRRGQLRVLLQERMAIRLLAGL